MKRIILITLLYILTLTLTACGYDFKEKGLYATIKTNYGKMVVKLHHDKTPITVGNFVALSEGKMEFINPKTGQKEKRPYYDGLIFHRIIKNFMIQGGCPRGDGRGSPGYQFIDEFHPELKHNSEGILSMANSGPGTNGSQFFITLVPTPHLDGRHTVFGKLVHGKDVLQKIGQVKTGQQDKPVDDVKIKNIEIRRVGPEAEKFDALEAFKANEKALEKIASENEEKLKELYKKLRIAENRIVTTDSGLKYYVRRNGTGAKPDVGNTISAHYTGYLVDGKKFDSSIDRKEPIQIPIGVGRVIKGWDEAFLTMKTGEKRVLIIPFDLAYGAGGRPPVIPPMATLVFEVELVKVQK